MAVNVDLLLLVVDDVSGGDNTAVAHAEMEESEQVVDVLSCKEIWHFESKVEPSWNTDLSISARNTAIWRNIFLNLHMHLVSVRIKIKHYRLFSKPVLVMNLCRYLIQILVYGLLNIQCG